MINVNQVASQLARMPDQALQQFAAMHKDDPYTLSMALSESNRRKDMRAGAQAKGGQQPKVVDQVVQGMGPPQAPQQPMPQPMPQQPQPAQAGRQLPEEQGIGALPAPNMQGMADGGIVGFAEGKRVFSADKYLEDPRVQRFLEYINKYEGSPKENQTVGYHQFDDLSKHPNRRVKFNKRGDKSTAAGAYQIINHTWQDQAKKQGLEDFSLENQKRAAIGVLQETGALDALMNNDIEKAKQRAARAWASIPGSTLGESTGQKAKFNPRAEQVLADITPQKVAETKKPAPAPVRAAERQETVGLSPERARQITEALPFASARAEDGIPALIKKEATGKTKDLTAKPEDRRAPLPAGATPVVPKGDASVPGSPADIAYQAQLKAERGPEKSYLAQRGQELLGAPEALTSLVTGAFSPATGAVRAGIDRLLGGNMSVAEGAGRMTYAPRFEAGQESLSQAQRALEDYKVPPFIPGIATSRSRLRAPKAIRAAEAAAETAAQKAAKVEPLRLEPPKPAPKPGVTPESAALGEQAKLQRRQQALVQDRQAAMEAQRQAGRAGSEANTQRTLDLIDRRYDAEQAARAAIASKVLPAAEVGANVEPFSEPEAPPVSDVYPDEMLRGIKPSAAADTLPVAEVPIEERSRIEPKEAKKGFGFSDDDLMMLGLNLMAGKSQHALTNLGEAGIATLGAKREREKLAAEKEQRNIMANYYSKQAAAFGTSPDERMIERMQKDPAYAAAIEKFQSAKYAARGAITPALAFKEYNELYAKDFDDSFKTRYPNAESYISARVASGGGEGNAAVALPNTDMFRVVSSRPS